MNRKTLDSLPLGTVVRFNNTRLYFVTQGDSEKMLCGVNGFAYYLGEVVTDDNDMSFIIEYMPIGKF